MWPLAAHPWLFLGSIFPFISHSNPPANFLKSSFKHGYEKKNWLLLITVLTFTVTPSFYLDAGKDLQTVRIGWSKLCHTLLKNFQWLISLKVEVKALWALGLAPSLEQPCLLSHSLPGFPLSFHISGLCI